LGGAEKKKIKTVKGTKPEGAEGRTDDDGPRSTLQGYVPA